LSADLLVIGWRRDDKLCWRCRRWCRRGKRYVIPLPLPSTGVIDGANTWDREDMVVDGRSGPNKQHDMGNGRVYEMCLYKYETERELHGNRRWKQVYINSARIYEIRESNIVELDECIP
jgi:hypothetical protein